MAPKVVQHNDSEHPVRMIVLSQVGAVVVMLLAVVFSMPTIKRKE